MCQHAALQKDIGAASTSASHTTTRLAERRVDAYLRVTVHNAPRGGYSYVGKQTLGTDRTPYWPDHLITSSADHRLREQLQTLLANPSHRRCPDFTTICTFNMLEERMFEVKYDK